MKSPFDTSRAGSGFLHGSRFARGFLNPRAKRVIGTLSEAQSTANTKNAATPDKAGKSTAKRAQPARARTSKPPQNEAACCSC